MSVQILEDRDTGYKCLYNAQTMQVFGFIFYEDDDVCGFLEWLQVSALLLTNAEMDDKIYEWRESLQEGK